MEEYIIIIMLTQIQQTNELVSARKRSHMNSTTKTCDASANSLSPRMRVRSASSKIKGPHPYPQVKCQAHSVIQVCTGIRQNQFLFKTLHNPFVPKWPTLSDLHNKRQINYTTWLCISPTSISRKQTYNL